MRNLNDYEIMGRKLRVDFSHEQKGGGDDDNNQVGSIRRICGIESLLSAQATSLGLPGSNGVSSAAFSSQSSTLPPLPNGKELPPGVNCTDAISRTLNTLPPPQLLDILAQMKALAVSEPQRATELLQQAPQLAYAVFQALLLMGLISPEAIQSVVEPGVPASQPPAGYPGAPLSGYQPAPVANNTPTPQGYGAPIIPPAASAQDTDALMKAVMELPQAQIDMFSETERQQIMVLRANFTTQRR